MFAFRCSFIFKFCFVFSVLLNIIWLHRILNLNVELFKKHSWSKTQTSEAEKYFLKNKNYSNVVNITVCPSTPPDLVGTVPINYENFKNVYAKLNAQEKNDNKSAYFEPNNCLPTMRLAIIIPFRDREQHLNVLLGHLHPFLKKQRNSFQVFVINQIEREIFNKGRLMNTGFKYAQRIGQISGRPFDCFIFHDVDMLPENDYNIYKCHAHFVYHLACSVDKFEYKPLCCGITVGGVLSFTEKQYEEINGFPNNYWGWGGEDDDVYGRIKFHKLQIKRPPLNLCRYTMIKHELDVRNNYDKKAVNERIRTAGSRFLTNGLNNLYTEIISIEYYPLYVNVTVDVGIMDSDS